MREYLFRRRILILLVLGYVMVSLYGPKMGRAEFYPFFNWDLFGYTHSIRHDVVVIVHSINGVNLEKPTIYFYVRDVFFRTASDEILLRKLLWDLWGHHRKGNQKQVDNFLDIIRSKYFSEVRAAEYEIALIKYNPIERLKTGKIEFSRTFLRASK